MLFGSLPVRVSRCSFALMLLVNKTPRCVHDRFPLVYYLVQLFVHLFDFDVHVFICLFLKQAKKCLNIITYRRTEIA